MHLIGRWERVRELGPHGWGPGLLYDRKWNVMRPNTATGEWWRCRSGFWHRVVQILTDQAGALRGAMEFGCLTVGFPQEQQLSFTTTTLNSNYVYVTTGNATGGRLQLPATKTLTDVYFFIVSYGGTAANVNDLLVEVRDDSSKPGATLHSSVVVDPASATGWIKATGFTQTITGGTLYWIVVGDPDGGASNAVIQGRCSVSSSNVVGEIRTMGAWFANATTANGWSTASINTAIPVFVLVFNDGSVVGFPFTNDAAPSNDANQKGLRMVGGFTEDVKLWGAKIGSVAGFTALNVWSGTDGPGGSPTAQGTKALVGVSTLTTTQHVGVMFDSAVTLTGGADYRITFDNGASNMQVPRKAQIGTGADANLRAAMLGGGNWYSTSESAGAWSDSTSEFPLMALLVEDVVAIAGGGGGGIKLAGRGGLAG